jgi:hypothetical protein
MAIDERLAGNTRGACSSGSTSAVCCPMTPAANCRMAEPALAGLLRCFPSRKLRRAPALTRDLLGLLAWPPPARGSH